MGPGLLVAAGGIGAGDIVSSTVGEANFGIGPPCARRSHCLSQVFLNEGAARCHNSLRESQPLKAGFVCIEQSQNSCAHRRCEERNGRQPVLVLALIAFALVGAREAGLLAQIS
jgi:hypothetical protein